MEAAEFTYALPVAEAELEKARARWEAWDARGDAHGDTSSFGAVVSVSVGLILTLVLLQIHPMTLWLTLPILAMILSIHLGGADQNRPPHPNQIGEELRLRFDATSVSVDRTPYAYIGLSEAVLLDTDQGRMMQLRTNAGAITRVPLPEASNGSDQERIAAFLQQGMQRAGSTQDIPAPLQSIRTDAQ